MRKHLAEQAVAEVEPVAAAMAERREAVLPGAVTQGVEPAIAGLAHRLARPAATEQQLDSRPEPVPRKKVGQGRATTRAHSPPRNSRSSDVLSRSHQPAPPQTLEVSHAV